MSPRFLACITDGPVKWESMGEGTMIGSNKEKQTEVISVSPKSMLCSIPNTLLSYLL